MKQYYIRNMYFNSFDASLKYPNIVILKGINLIHTFKMFLFPGFSFILICCIQIVILIICSLKRKS